MNQPNDAELEIHVQRGDDLLLWELFKRFHDRVYVETCTNHPIKLRQTYLLEQQGYKLVRQSGAKNWYVTMEDRFPASLTTRFQLIRKCYITLFRRRMRDWLKG